MAQTKKKSEHYVNNKEFLAAMVEYKKSVDKAKKEKRNKPRVPDYVGECFLKIANHLSYRPNFINYTFRDDMISDGIENCLQYLDNFNPKTSNNPFAYFTQIIYYAFIRRIQKLIMMIWHCNQVRIENLKISLQNSYRKIWSQMNQQKRKQ